MTARSGNSSRSWFFAFRLRRIAGLLLVLAVARSKAWSGCFTRDLVLSHSPSRFLFPVLASVLLVTACEHIPEVENAKNTAETVQQQITPYLEQLTKPSHHYKSVLIEQGPWTGLRLKKADRAEHLPAHLQRDDSIIIPLGGDLTLGDMASRIAGATGLGVHFVGTPLNATNASTANNNETTDKGFRARLIGKVTPSGEGVWQGSLPDLLDEWVAGYGYDWRYNEQRSRLEIIRSASSIFEIHALGGTQDYTVISSTTEQASGEGDDQSTANFSTQSLKTSYSYNPWKQITKQLGVIVSEPSQFEVSPETGTVVVRGLPRDITAARHYFAHLNETILRPINVTVRLLYVSRAEEANYSGDIIGSLAKILGQNFGLSVVGTGTASAIALVKPSPMAGDTAEVTISALRQLGTVSRVLSAGVPSLPGKPAQYFELFRDSYLASVSTKAIDGVVATTLTPGSISSGFSFSYTGQITGPDRALLRIAVALQDRPELENFTSAGNTIQLPDFASRGINVTQTIRSRETMIIAGFSEQVTNSKQSGQFYPDNPLLGGRQTGSTTANDIVLLLSFDLGESFGISETREKLL